jgi:hypothetical protein
MYTRIHGSKDLHGSTPKIRDLRIFGGWRERLAELGDDLEAVVVKVAEAVGAALDELHPTMKPSMMPLLRVKRHLPVSLERPSV